MKSKPNIGSLQEAPSLQVCHGSTKISKASPPQVKMVAQSTNSDNLLQICRSDCSNIENYSTGESDEPQDCYCTGESDTVSSFLLLSPYSTSLERVERINQESPCSSPLEAFLSPIPGNDITLDKSTSDHHEAVHNNDHAELPHLVSDDSVDGRCSLSEYESWQLTEYNLSKMIDSPSLSFDESMRFSDLITSASPECDHVNSVSIFGMEEISVAFPSPERSLESEDLHSINTNEALVMNIDESLLYLTTHHLKQSGKETGLTSQSSSAEESDWVDPQFFIRVPDTSEVVSSERPLPLQKGIEKKAVTLVLDLDETLVHSSLVECDDADFSFQIFFNMKENTVYVRQRPYLHMFLNRVAQMFKIIIFTASQRIYAEKLLDVLDPGKKLITHRVYRESCVFSEGSYTKDLSILGVDLANIAIIDNSPQVFRLQVNNGIPIKSWFDDPSDNALIALLPFLETLVNVEDVRPIIAKRFN